MEAGDLTCKELVELVTDYLEGKLAPRDFTRFEDHISRCQGCRTYLEQMRETVRLLGHLREDALPDDVEDELLRHFRNWNRDA